MNFLDFRLHLAWFHVGDFAVEDDADASCFFRDYQNYAIVSLGNAYSCTVTETVTAW